MTKPITIVLGAIAGDILGSPYEGKARPRGSFELFHPKCTFTDDTVMTIAVADALVQRKAFDASMRIWGNRYPDARYGDRFLNWLQQPDMQPYFSFGNGSAMRVSALGALAESEEHAMDWAQQSAAASHNHPEGIAGAQAIALAIFLARKGNSKEAIRESVSSQFKLDLNFTIESIRPHYRPDVTCRATVPHAIVAFLDSHDHTSALRLAISLGGDTDTLACMAGGIAAAYYGKIAPELEDFVEAILPDEFKAVLAALPEASPAENQLSEA